MSRRALASVVSVALIGSTLAPVPARADNAMGYRLITQEEAAGLPKNHGGLGLAVQRASVVNDTSGTTFDIMRVGQVAPNSPAAKAGLHTGDQIIALDGRVFPTLMTFAAYVGSLQPGSQTQIDYIPANGGPGQAQRVVATIQRPGEPASATGAPASSGGLSTGTKVAIGVGAAALLGCYELGCFSHRRPVSPAGQTAAQPYPGQQGPQQQ